MIRHKAKESSIIIMGTFTMETGFRIRLQGMEYMLVQMETNMKVNGTMMFKMVWGEKFGWTVLCSKDIIKMV